MKQYHTQNPLDNLPDASLALLAAIARRGVVECDRCGWTSDPSAVAAFDLERRGLAHVFRDRGTGDIYALSRNTASAVRWGPIPADRAALQLCAAGMAMAVATPRGTMIYMAPWAAADLLPAGGSR